MVKRVFPGIGTPIKIATDILMKTAIAASRMARWKAFGRSELFGAIRTVTRTASIAAVEMVKLSSLITDVAINVAQIQKKAG